MAGRHRQVHVAGRQGRHRKPPRRGHVLLPTLAAAAVLGVGGVGASAALSGGGHDSSPSAARSGPTGVTSRPTWAPPASAGMPGTSSTAPARPAPRPTPDFAITVTGRASWVQVVGPHAKVLFAGMLRHGKTLTYKQRPLAVTLGNAGAVRLVLHHHVQARAGRLGEVLSFTVS